MGWPSGYNSIPQLRQYPFGETMVTDRSGRPPVRGSVGQSLAQS